jgi:spermidine synthase
MVGPSPTFVANDMRLAQSYLVIDGDAATVAYGISGDLSRAEFLKYDLTNLAYYIPGRHTAAVIGVGGGRDLLSARVFGIPQATGVEINPTFVNLLLDEPAFSEFVGLKKIGGIKLFVDEARSWFARSEETFDVIQMSLTDTWAATGAGAFTLSENGLYTVEAWQIFLRHLSPNGVLAVSRWYSPQNTAETGRMVSLAVAALLESGATNPKDHIFLAASGRIATLIVSRSGFSAAELHSLTAAAQRLRFDQLIVPGQAPTSDVLSNIVNARSLSDLDHYTGTYRLDLTPPTDDRPFFFNQLPIYDAAKVLAFALSSGASPGVGSGNLKATITLVMLFFIALGFVVAVILVPLRFALRDVGARLAIGGTAYFMLIGVGFMLIEIGLLQRFSVFLGHPIYSLSIVLFSLILSTGIGSFVSDYIGIEKKAKFTLWAIATGGYILSQVVWVPPLLLSLDSHPLVLRGLVAIAVILPAGLLMGYGFPTGMRFISAVDRGPTPWFWGINGASGVLASAVAVGCSIAVGIGTTLTLGAACYFLLIPAALIIGFPDVRRRTAAEPAAVPLEIGRSSEIPAGQV